VKASQGSPSSSILKIRDDFPQDPAACQALYRLGVLQADPLNPQKDYRASRETFTRLLVEYPRSPWDSDARLAGGPDRAAVAGRRVSADRATLRKVEEDL